MAQNLEGTDTPNFSDSAASTTAVNVPDKPALEGLEDKYSAQWRENGTYAFDEDTTRESVYSIDTPLPRPPAPCTWDTCSPTRRRT